MRTSTRAGIAAALLSGLLLMGCGGDDGDSNGASNGGGGGDDAASVDISVIGNDQLEFDKSSYTATAGTVTIELVNDGSIPHTLLFEEDDVDFDKLSVSGQDDTDRGTVELTPGTYTIYCDVVGHTNMRATLVVN